MKTKTRKLISGRIVKESETLEHCITTKCSEKWVHFDLEDGNIWIIKNDRHARLINDDEIKEVLHILSRYLTVNTLKGMTLILSESLKENFNERM
jgi:hypothetical protein